MAVFFFAVGLEIKREFSSGSSPTPEGHALAGVIRRSADAIELQATNGMRGAMEPE